MSTAHSRALHAHLRAGGNEHDQSRAPANPKRVIGRSSPDETLQGTETHSARRRRLAAEGQSCSDSPGAFDKLRSDLRPYLESHGGGADVPAATKQDFDVNEQLRLLRAQPKVSGQGRSLGVVAKALTAAGNTALAKSLTAGSAIRKQSLSKRIANTTVGGDPKPAPKPRLLTKAEIASACSYGMSLNRMSTEDAMRVQSCMDLDRPLPGELLKAVTDLRKECMAGAPAQKVAKPLAKAMPMVVTSTLLKGSAVLDLIQRGISNGKLSSTDAIMAEGYAQGSGMMPVDLVNRLKQAAK